MKTPLGEAATFAALFLGGFILFAVIVRWILVMLYNGLEGV